MIFYFQLKWFIKQAFSLLKVFSGISTIHYEYRNNQSIDYSVNSFCNTNFHIFQIQTHIN